MICGSQDSRHTGQRGQPPLWTGVPPSKASLSAAEAVPVIANPTPAAALAATNLRRLIAWVICGFPLGTFLHLPVGTAIISTVIVRFAMPTPCTIIFDAAGGREGS